MAGNAPASDPKGVHQTTVAANQVDIVTLTYSGDGEVWMLNPSAFDIYADVAFGAHHVATAPTVRGNGTLRIAAGFALHLGDGEGPAEVQLVSSGAADYSVERF